MYELADGTMSTDYKVGDKFVLVEDSCFFKEGQVITLFSDDGTVCPFFEDEVACHWDSLKAYKEQVFTKSDLKDGMVVTYRDGGARLVFNGKTYYSTTESQRTLKTGFIIEQHFDETLKNIDEAPRDIMKVEYMGKVLWEREEEAPEQKEIKRLQGIIKEAQDALNVINTGNK